MNEFLIGKKDFLLNGEPIRIIAGAMHYFRVPREYWRDRLLKIKACGFNAVETYTAWNLHEPEEGKFDFSGQLDLKAFLDLINELGMYAIVRPGPYICSEWEFGGFPWWLLKYDDIELRCMNETYLQKVDRYFDEIIPIIASCEINKGGSVIMVQVENEYGSYGDDENYIKYIEAGLLSRGITSALITSDGDCDCMLTGGTTSSVHKTCNFGSGAKEAFRNLRKFQPEGPLMCMEYWNGWFDHWEEKHHSRDPKDAADCFKDILDCGASISVYMMHGGTNFGYMNGANCTDTEYQPTVNSYDDDAPINEYGALTEKYHLFKQVCADFGYVNDVEISNPVTKDYGVLQLTETADLLKNIPVLSEAVTTVLPQNMEKLGQGYGYIMYECFVRGPRETADLYIDAHDRAYVFADDKFIGIQYRNDKKRKVKLQVPAEGVKLSILVENMGRINYGPYLKDKKGLVAPVRLGNQILHNWNTYCLPFDNINELVFERKSKIKYEKKPVFLRGNLLVDEPCDTFVELEGFKKGLVWVNGMLLSRYWEKGPQQTAYLPGCYLNKGINEIIVFECEGFKKPQIKFVAEPKLNK